MSLMHEFLLMSSADQSPLEYRSFAREHVVGVHDDLLQYMADSLKWIPTLNPARNERGFGLNLYGPTAILQDGAPIAASVFRSWAQLLGLAPQELVLTGPWTTIEGWQGSGEYAQLRFDRDDVVATLETAATYFTRVADSHGEWFVLHRGV